MSDEWLKEAERRGDEADDYANWIDANEDSIIEQWSEKLDIDDVPETFINNLYEQHLEHRDEE